MVTIYELHNDVQDSARSHATNYGKFQPIYHIRDFRMMEGDKILESGNKDFVYMSRRNSIYYMYVTEEAMKQAKRKKAKEHLTYNMGDIGHPNLQLMTKIESRYQKFAVNIENFRIYFSNNNCFVYAQTKTHLYFNNLIRFGKLFSGSKILPPTVARSDFRIYTDENYKQIAMFSDPYEIRVLPYLHSNRISLRGIHHEPKPICYQAKGQEDLHLLTEDSELKTWSTNTGKLVKCEQLPIHQFKGFKKLNQFRGRFIIYKQDMKTMKFIYKCIEIVSSKEVIDHKTIVTDYLSNMFVSINNDFIYMEEKNMSRRNIWGISVYDDHRQQIKKAFKTFNHRVPLNFMSPSFINYIYIESHNHKIKVRQTKDDAEVCVIPKDF